MFIFKRKVILLGLTLFLIFAAAAANWLKAAPKAETASRIRGIVKDIQTGDLLPGANIIITKTSLGATTATDGSYEIRNVPPGSYTMRATYIGYSPSEISVQVKEGADIEQNFSLSPVGIEGETIVVTAQAEGQQQAINQQLSAQQIMNVVSSARIQELPDANAAESVGRLPGVSVLRDGGEGAKVVIRGLSPKYNRVMIDGIQMAATDNSDRSSDLSMISPNMLEGIEVMKAITPDQDADVFGGTVNFKMREAGDGRQGIGFDVLSQGGYNSLQKTYRDYKFVGSTEARFFEQSLGVFAQVDVERRNRISNELGAVYTLNAPQLNAANRTYLNTLNLADIPRDRRRYGGTLALDYRIPDGKINLVNFLSSSDTRIQRREENYDLIRNTHDYTTTDSRNKLNVMTNILGFEKSFSSLKVNAKVAHSYSENNSPENLTFQFNEPTAGFAGVNRSMDPKAIVSLARNSLKDTYLQNITDTVSFAREREYTAALDFQTDANISNLISTTFKVGGKYRYRTRSYDHNQGGGRIDLASGTDVRQSIITAFPWMQSTVPNGSYRLPIMLFNDQDFNYGTFLGGDYPMGIPVNTGLMKQVLEVVKKKGSLEAYSYNDYASKTSDYSGNENRSAGYAMATIKFGQAVTFIPGVRYEFLVTNYTGSRGIQTSSSRYTFNSRDTTMRQTHSYWLPMVHLRYKPLPWFDVRLAYTNTLNFPDYKAIIPRIDVGLNKSVTWNNFRLKPARSTNYDLYLSFYENFVGLFTAGGFYKRINDLIFTAANKVIIDPAQYEGVPSNQRGAYVFTSINNPNKVDLWGVELDWQTHFWYIPVLSGLVFNINYTHVFSEAKYPLTTVNNSYVGEPPRLVQTVTDTFYTNRLIDQPNDIVNLSVGYDLAGFSVRVSMLYQDNVFGQENFWPELRVNTDKYLRWDLSAKQDLPWFGLQVFLNLNNINGARDVDLNQGSSFPASEQHYGMTADVGFRMRL